MDYVKNSILDLDITEELKSELTDDSLLKKHHLYLQLATFLRPAFTEVSAEDVNNITFFGYLYFRFLLNIDNVLDCQGNSNQSVQVVQRFFGSICTLPREVGQ